MNRTLRAFVSVVALLALTTGAVTAADAPTGKWRIQFQGRATNDGEMHLRVTPQTGEPIIVTIKIARGRGELFMAKDVLEGFKTQLPKLRFKSEIVHGQEVLLKAGHEEPAFALELMDSTVEGSRMILGPA
jgi:hypothetical protein